MRPLRSTRLPDKILDRMGGKEFSPSGRGNNVSVFLYSVAIAVAFWILVSLSKSYNGVIAVSLTYLHLPENKKVVSNLPSVLEIEVNARGSDLILNQVGIKKTTIQVDVNSCLSQLPPAERKKGAFPTDLLSGQIIEKTGSDLRIIRIYPQYIFLDASQRSVKKVPVKCNFVLSFQKQFGILDSIRIYPDSVLISGPEKVLKDIDHMGTESLRFTGISESFSQDAKLVKRSKNIFAVSEKNVKVTVPVEKYTEGSVEVEVEKINGSSSFRKIKLNPDRVKIVYQVGLSNYKKVSASSFSVVADFADAQRQPQSRIPLTLAKYPSFVKSIRMKPGKVDYFVQD